jgi:hypothetical protein
VALTATRIVRRDPDAAARRIGGDICVLGAGIAGISAALEAAKLGRRIVLADGAPTLGGQSVGALIGTFCGLYSNGPKPYQVTYGIAEEIIRDLGAEGALHPIRGRRNTTILQYDEIALARWIERKIAASDIELILGATLTGVAFEDRRVKRLALATRFGPVEVEATGFVDASGDAALAHAAGLPCREPVGPVWGTQMLILEGFDAEALARIGAETVPRRLREVAERYGLARRDGFVFAVPDRGTALVNMTHVAVSLDPLEAPRAALAARAEADRLVSFLRREFPGIFGRARVRSYGLPGMRQTRWIVGRHHLTADEVRAGTPFSDAVARASWPIELHDRPDDVHWEVFGDDHMHYVPLGSLVAADADNLIAAGRTIDGDVAALSAVRVMGPCIATGAAAAHALDLAGAGALDQIDLAALKTRLRDNLERRDPGP